MQSNLSGPISGTMPEERESDHEQAEGEQAGEQNVEIGDEDTTSIQGSENEAMEDDDLILDEISEVPASSNSLPAQVMSTHRIVADDEVWIGWLRGHPKANTWRSRTIDYDKLSMVFGRDSATGRFARSSVDATTPNIDADG
ncbi:hypothetical protein AAC387_Pa07g2365 [Persea americana]